ncbi:MAG: pantetheine-phosphate adenylyltransferase [Planctomycetota bacterium]|jgi:pantetheine-phosphate adenylyltransferase|nr:pantetheine-phosphate adenylyltransferase [Planctomycetota bacterium]
MTIQLSPYKAVYTGSFDPVTLGHLDIIERSARLYDSLVIGVGVNSAKQSLFSTDERIDLLQRVTRHLPHVSIERFDGLAVDFVRNIGARVMVRGVRPLTDIAAEFTMMMANRQLDSDIETVFLMADEVYAHVSSTLIKQIASLGHGRSLDRFVPSEIIPTLMEKVRSIQHQALSE